MKKVFDTEKYKTYYELLNDVISPSFREMKKVLICDCDGVITNGTSLCGTDGKIGKTYGSHDKEMLDFIKTLGMKIIFISADMQGYDITKNRISHLGYDLFDVKPNDRLSFIQKYKDEGYYIIYVGDSISDIPALSAADFSACPKNSFKCVAEYCDYQSEYCGGQGALADILLNFIQTQKINLS